MKVLYHHRTRATDAQRVHIREIIQGFRQMGHTVEVAALVDAEKPEQDAAREAVESGWKKVLRRTPFAYELVQVAYNAFAVPWLWWKLRRSGADFIYERYSLFNCSGVLAGRLAGRPVILEVNSPFALEQHREKEIRAARFALWMERMICNAATKVIVVSSPLRRIMIENGVRDSRLELMTNGVNLAHLNSVPADELRRTLKLDGKVVIGFVGWFRKWHGIEFLLEAFAQSALQREGAVLVLIGDGPAMPDLKRRAAELGLSDTVIFTGPVPHEKIPPYLSLVDIAVQPAANEYCCPMKIIEYMGLGKAIVAPRQENIEEILRDGHDAALFPPQDIAGLVESLRTLVRGPDRRALLGERALESIHRRGLLWTKNAERVVQLVTVAGGMGPAPLGGEVAR
jgi:glycosyltransferase involved in cell wall biosynthesis